MNTATLHKVISILTRERKKWHTPAVTQVSLLQDPFRVLISTLLSLRTKDEITLAASKRLFRLARTPRQMMRLSERKVRELIYPVGFYKTKAKRILEICRTLLEKYQGKVPHRMEDLLRLKGVGRKTANLVLTLGFQELGICVDTHVHRIANRLGMVRTKTPEQTEFALRKTLPRKYWIRSNDLLVAFGQTLCRPVSPWCSRCPVEGYCKKRGVASCR